MSNNEYDPNSTDAMFATILNELKMMREKQETNSNKLDEALQRVSALESFKIWAIGMAAGVSAVVAVFGSFVKWLIHDNVSK